jgi:hypothetical protein
MTTDLLPSPKLVRDTLADLLAKDVTVAPTDPITSAALPRTVVAVYVNDQRKLTGVLGLDLALAAYVSAALGLVPPGGAKACIEDGALSPMLAENLAEICNILLGLFNREGQPHIRLHQVCYKEADVPLDARAHLLALGNRIDLTVDVDRYGKGVFSLSLAP